jgi:outer membrane protein TolC
VAQLTAAGIPTFSMVGEIEVEQGVLAGLNTVATLRSLARGAAVEVLDLLDGRETEPAPLLDYGARLSVNMETARELDLGLSWEVLSDAKLLHMDAYAAGLPIDLEGALERAVTANLDLLVEDRVVAAGAEEIREARSSYRPQLDVAAYGVAIDSDRAFPAMGNYEKYAAGSLELSQLIYSDRASASIKVQKNLQRARVADRESLRLDIARTAAEAYLDLMRTEALVRIRQDDVDLNRANLDVARLRRSVGAAGSAEIYRWEAQLAAARAALLEAHSTRRLAARQLSRLLDYPVTTDWQAGVPDLEEGLCVLGGAGEAPLLDTPSGYDRLNEMLLERGLAASPELAALDAAIEAQKRATTAARRETYAPTVGLAAQVDQIAVKSEGGGLDLGPIGDLVPGVDDTFWNVGLRVSLPLYTGGAIKARRIRADEQLSGLRLQRRSVNEKISQRILSALDRAAASWPAITLRRQSADAAARTLELVQDAYGRGASSILDLLDAQNAALTAEFAAETAVYDFLEDWAEVQRSVADLGPDS